MFKTREYFITTYIYIGVLITISSEILGLFNHINHISIKVTWILFFLLFLYIFFKKKFLTRVIHFYKRLLWYFLNYKILLAIFFFFILTFITSLIYPPNTLDAMSYHLPKVMHWIQNGSLNFYPTNDIRQLILAPFTELVILHLYLLTGGDSFLNLVQWYAMLVSCTAVSLISRELGCNAKFQVFSILFCVTLPMGILQSNSTQTDYVASSWLLVMIYFMLRYIRLKLVKYLFYFSFSLALGIFTKGTFYVFAFPFCIWLGLNILLKNKKYFFYLLFIPLIIFFLNFGHFSRNINFSGNPLGFNIGDNPWINKGVGPNAFIGNFLKNFGLNLAVPNERLNKTTAKTISKLIQQFNIDPADPQYTLIPQYGYYIPFSLYESTAPNTPHFIIILVLFISFFVRKKNQINLRFYFYSVLATFVLFSLLNIWDGRNNRYLLCFFVISAPFVAYMLNRFNLIKLSNVLAIFLILYSLPYLLFNKSRPLLANINIEKKKIQFYKPYFLSKDRFSQYFIADKLYNIRSSEKKYLDIIEKINNSDCFIIGVSNQNYIEYPLWVLLKNNELLKKKQYHLLNININNPSNVYKSLINNYTKICAILDIDKNLFYAQ
jgi:hypothetical protein